jgi:hypothetical protein
VNTPDEEREELIRAAEIGTDTCATCCSWNAPEGAGPGQCRRRSPRAVEDRRTGAWRSQWPPTWGHDWCAEWRFNSFDLPARAKETDR